jgi:2-polyprenyl-6-methoxyphenol hydroxylase-like FAD-dependent oxidoreductase
MPPQHARSKHIVVIGGSVAGLGVALALSNRGHRVTILEADATPLPESHTEAFATWNRQGAPQTGHSHALLARLRNLIRDHAPGLLDELEACGAEQLRFTDRARQLFDDPPLEPEDDDIVALACRRVTFEWVLRRHVIATDRVELRDGARVLGLESRRDAGARPPTVTGVRVDLGRGGGETRIEADVVVDASGRRSALRRWLPEIGTAPVREASSPCGIFYTSRFYHLRDGIERPPLDGGIVGVDLGYLKVGLFAGDSRVFSITLAASPTDDDMRGVLHRPAFESAVAAIPLTAEWTAPDVAEPVSDVHGMANLNNVRRYFVEDGEPLALGVLPVGDSVVHTNPIVGRGCSLAWTSAFALADCLEEHPDDLRALALAYETHLERDIVPWYELQVDQDADAIEIAEAQRRGEDPYATQREDGSGNPKGFIRSLMRDGLGPALEEDFRLLRHFMRTLHLLDRPGAMMKNPEVMQSLLASYERRHERPKRVLGPSRDEMLAHFAARAA